MSDYADFETAADRTAAVIVRRYSPREIARSYDAAFRGTTTNPPLCMYVRASDYDALNAQVDELEKFYADGLHAWRENSRASAARIAELEALLSEWRASVDMVRSAGVDSAHAAKMVRNGVEQRMYEAAKNLIADGGSQP